MLCGKPCAGLLKGSRVKLVHKFDLCSLVLLQAEPVASAAAPSSNRGAPGFGVVVRVDARLIARHSGGSVLGKASASTEEVGGFVIWYVPWGSHHLRLLSCVCSWKRASPHVAHMAVPGLRIERLRRSFSRRSLLLPKRAEPRSLRLQHGETAPAHPPSLLPAFASLSLASATVATRAPALPWM